MILCYYFLCTLIYFFSRKKMPYRPEIDGLRALAVLPVLFFHAGFAGFDGGFVGVDIFFVISGFLITGILLNENESGRYSVLSFYERRARRLLPALFCVLLFTTAASLILLPPEQLNLFGRSLISSVVGLANVFFSGELDYFSLNAEEMPLLHIWSLSLEEQYYVALPLLLSLAYFLQGRALAFLGCVCIFIASYYCMMRYGSLGYSNDAFYSLLSRAWELVAGGLLAFGINRVPTHPALRQVGSLAGLVLVLGSIAMLDANGWPSHQTLFPVVGTLLLIAFAHTSTWVGKVLTMKPMLFIGAISYSLYLWHQPLYALARNIIIGHPSAYTFVFLMLLSTLLAYLTYRFVETPFRNKKRWPRRSIFTVSLSGIILLGTIGGAIYFGKGLPGRYQHSALPVPTQIDRKCITVGADYATPGAPLCHRNPDKALKIAVFGDSHSNEIAISLAQALPERGVMQLSFSGCPPAYNFEVIRPDGCTAWTRQAVQYLVDTPAIDTVVFAYRHSLHMYGEHLQYYPQAPNNPLHSRVLVDGVDQDEAESIYLSGFRAMIMRIVSSGKSVVLVGPFPELPGDIRDLAFPQSIFSNEPRVNIEKVTTTDYYQKRHGWWWLDLQSKPIEGVKLIAPHQRLCSESHCPLAINEDALYYDDDHLTPFAVDLFILDIVKAINKPD
jgi:peptidoglycan/LPS O-acetylase OafA/YrhL